VYSFISGTTVTLTAGTGTALIYIDASGTMTVGTSTLTLSCSLGCGALNGISAFPQDSIPLSTWTATNGVWDNAGGTDRRAAFSQKRVQAGTGIIVTEVGNVTQIAVDTAAINPPLIAQCNTSDPINYYIRRETFDGGGISGDGVGYGWTTNGGLTRLASPANRTGVVNLASTTGAGSVLMLEGAGQGRTMAPLSSTADFYFRFEFQLSGAIDGAMFTGLSDTQGTIAAANQVGLRWTGGDGANLRFVYCVAGSCTTSDSGVPNGDTNYHALLIKRISNGAATLCVDSCGSAVTLTLPTVAMSPAFRASHTTTAVNVRVDDWLGCMKQPRTNF
jgi:hypothetical protein